MEKQIPIDELVAGSTEQCIHLFYKFKEHAFFFKEKKYLTWDGLSAGVLRIHRNTHTHKNKDHRCLIIIENRGERVRAMRQSFVWLSSKYDVNEEKATCRLFMNIHGSAKGGCCCWSYTQPIGLFVYSSSSPSSPSFSSCCRFAAVIFFFCFLHSADLLVYCACIRYVYCLLVECHHRYAVWFFL